MTDAEVLQTPSDADLLAWDWRAALKADERSIPWLARHTDRNAQTVYAYASGRMTAPIGWLRSVARLLGKAGAS